MSINTRDLVHANANAVANFGDYVIFTSICNSKKSLDKKIKIVKEEIPGVIICDSKITAIFAGEFKTSKNFALTYIIPGKIPFDYDKFYNEFSN
jgi:hypothetical protein